MDLWWLIAIVCLILLTLGLIAICDRTRGRS